MKQIIFFLTFLFVSVSAFAQIPTGYYNTATGTGYVLKTQLYNKIKNHTNVSYGGLWTAYSTTDRDNQYENDNTILDLYSENPTGTDPVIFNYATNQCGTYTTQGMCYNREHIIPQSIFASASPMLSDAHFVVPVDGYVNGMRSDNPHGNVAVASWTSLNGSKRGTSGVIGYTGTVFEPLDAFKGDIARMYFYFATRYENLVASYTSYPMFNSTSNQVFSNAFLNMLIAWHNLDPVNAHEISRNNAIYALQNNRNPFIDHPEYVGMIWGGTSTGTKAQTITFSALTNAVYGSPSFNLNATASSGLSVSYASSNTNVATISGNVVTIVGAGTTTITATQSGNSTYANAPSVKQSFTVTQKSITATATANNKSYDGTTVATLSGTLNGIIGADIVTFIGTGTFASANIGTNIAVTSTSTLGGLNANNYSLIQPNNLVANITAIPSVALLQWNTFGNLGTETTEPSSFNDANISSSELNYLGSSVLTSSNGNRFGGSNWAVGVLNTTKYIQFTVTPNAGFSFTPTSFDFIWDFSTTGPNAVSLRSSIDNYVSDIGSLTTMTTSTSSVKTILISNLTNITTPTTFRLYGYNATGTVGAGGFDCAVSTNNVVLKGSTTLTMPPTISTSGTLTAFSSYYGFTSSEAILNVSGVDMLSGILVTAHNGFEVSLTSGSGFGTSVVVGSAGTISSTPVYIRLASTNLVGNYGGDIALSSSGVTTSNVAIPISTVNPAILSINGLTANNKFFDGNATATLNGNATLVGVLPTDIANVILNGTPIAIFISSTIGNAIPVDVSGYSISGSSAANYLLSQPQNLVADILPVSAPILSSSLTANSIYGVPDSAYIITANNNPTSFNATGLPTGLTVNTTTGAISGTAITVGTFNVTISATNIAGSSTATLVYTINPKPLTIIGAVTNNKKFDSLATATISGSILVGVVGNDSVTISTSGYFTTTSVGVGIPVISTQVLGGADASKYTLVLPTNLSATINKANQKIILELPDKHLGDPPFTLHATGGPSGNPIVFTSSNTAVITIVGNVVTIVGIGKAYITANQAGNSIYAPATSVVVLQLVK